MKFFSFLFILAAAVQVHARTPMDLVEKASHRLMSMVKNGEVPAYTSTDLSRVDIQVGNNSEVTISLSSPSQNADEPNRVTLVYSSDGKVLRTEKSIVSQAINSPIFPAASGALILDHAAEAVVDHLNEPTSVDVANNTLFIELFNQDGATALMHLKDGRVYRVLLDLDGDVISRGF